MDECMKISFISPGSIEIPPKSHGAVEIIIWNYKLYLERLGWEVQITNNRNFDFVPDEINSFNPDFVHIHLDHLYFLSNKIYCKNIALTNHDGYAEWPELRPPSYNEEIKNGTKNFRGYHFCLSDRMRQFYITHFGINSNKVFSLPNGANKDDFVFSSTPIYYDKTMCLGVIHADQRKNQVFLSDCDSNITFVGPCDQNVIFKDKNYMGSWDKTYLYSHLTEYPNLVLLSKGEAAPLVCVEALMSGLGLVISEKATANLDTSLPFIEVIPSNYMYDMTYIKQAIEKNREISIKYRMDIREYALETFDWEKLVKRYHNLLINKIL
jgi:glycosyltransferase involved in cell wall biosynthesis